MDLLPSLAHQKYGEGVANEMKHWMDGVFLKKLNTTKSVYIMLGDGKSAIALWLFCLSL